MQEFDTTDSGTPKQNPGNSGKPDIDTKSRDLLGGATGQAREFARLSLNPDFSGVSKELIRKATEYAKAAGILGTSTTKAMELLVATENAFHTEGRNHAEAFEAAEQATPKLANFLYASEAAGDFRNERTGEKSLSLIRFMGAHGAFKSTEKFQKTLDAIRKAIRSTGNPGLLDELNKFREKGGAVAQDPPDIVLLARLAPVISRMGGENAGMDFTDALSHLTGNARMGSPEAHFLIGSNVWDAPKVIRDEKGAFKGAMGPDVFKDMSAFLADPAAFHRERILSRYEKMNDGRGLDAAERYGRNRKLFREHSDKMLPRFERQGEAIGRAAAAQARIPSLDEAVRSASQIPSGKEIDRQAEWNPALLELGRSILPETNFKPDMEIAGLNGPNHWRGENMRAAKLVAESLAGPAAAMTAFGAAPAIRSPGGALGKVKDALTGTGEAARKAQGAAIYENRNGIQPKLAAVWEGVTGLFANLGKIVMDGLSGLLKTVKSWMPSWLGTAEAETARAGGGKETPAGLSPPPGRPFHVTVQNIINLDGRTIARNVAEHLYDGMNRAPSSPGGFDGRRSFTPSTLPATP